MIITVSDKVENYKPIYEINDGKYVVNFDRVDQYKNEVKLINGKFAATGNTVATGLASWKTIQFDSKPSLSDIKDVIIGNIDACTSYSIINLFEWNDCKVNLSTINQNNYKTAYDLAVQTNGANLPVKFKFNKDGQNFYYTFETVDELTDFYVKAIKHINACLEAGWEHKDSINWSDYNI